MNDTNNLSSGDNFGQHFDEATCLQFLEGMLDRSKALELSAHTERCAECRNLLSALKRETLLLTTSLREQEEAVPAHLLAGPGRDRTPWAWIGAFGLAAAGAYWMWTAFIDPGMEAASQAGFGGNDLLTAIFFQGAFWKGWDSMWTIIQALAAVSLGVVGFFLLRRVRRWNMIALVMGALAAALGLPFGASAAEVHRHEPNYILAAGDTVKNDLIVAGRTIRIDGTVDGDVILMGQTLTVNGHVTGDVIAFGNMLQINGTVDGSVRAFTSQLMVHGKIGQNLMGFTGQLQADPQSEIGWGATLYAGDGSLDGRVGRDVLSRSGYLTVNGFVGGNVDVKANRMLVIGPQAQIQGRFQYAGPSRPTVSGSAKLANPPEVKIEARSADYVFSGLSLWHQALHWGAWLLFGLVLLFVAPQFFVETVHRADRFGVSLGFGALFLIATPILAVLVCVTLVGLAVGISTLLLYAIAVGCAKVFIAAWLGRKMLGRRANEVFAEVAANRGAWPRAYTGTLIGHLALGLLALYVLRMIPYVGFWTALVAQLWGFGAIVLTLYARMRPASFAVEAAAA